MQVLLLARELKLLRVGLVSVDGSKFKANASKHRSVRYERAGALIAQLEGEIAALLSRAEAADVAGEDDPQALPKEIARREALRDKLDAARRRLEAQAQARAAAEREAWEAKVAAREKRRGRAKGKHPQPPTGTPAADAQSNLSDPDSRLMRKSKHHEYRQANNAQAAVDAGGSQLIVGARVSQCASDRNDLVADIEAIPAVLGRPETVLADNGYANGAEVAALLDEAETCKGVSVHAVAAMRLLLLTGCRKGEILNLRWDQVDMAAGELRLPDTKTGPRTISMAPEAVAVLSRIPRLTDNPFVIPGRIGGRAMRNLNDPWEIVCDRAGLEDMRIHDARHSYASRALALGESLPMIGRLLGHTQVETTARYAHLAQDSVRDSAVRVADSIAGDFLADYPGPENPGR